MYPKAGSTPRDVAPFGSERYIFVREGYTTAKPLKNRHEKPLTADDMPQIDRHLTGAKAHAAFA